MIDFVIHIIELERDNEKKLHFIVLYKKIAKIKIPLICCFTGLCLKSCRQF